MFGRKKVTKPITQAVVYHHHCRDYQFGRPSRMDVTLHGDVYNGYIYWGPYKGDGQRYDWTYCPNCGMKLPHETHAVSIPVGQNEEPNGNDSAHNS